MARERERSETTVGCFVAAGLFFLGVMIWSIESWHIFEPGYTVEVGYRNIAGLAVNSPVMVSGHQIGRVEEIRVHGPREPAPDAWGDTGFGYYSVTAVLWLPDEIHLFEDARMGITSQGFLGEMYVDITPGHVGREAGEGAFFRGADPIPLSEVIATGNQTLEGIQEVVSDLKVFSSFVADTDMQESMRRSVENTRRATEEIRAMVAENRRNITLATERINLIIDENRENIHATTANLREVSEDVRTIASDVRSNMQVFSDRMNAVAEIGGDTVLAILDEAHRATRTAREGVDRVMEDLSTSSGSLREFLVDNREEFDSAIVNFNEAADEMTLTLAALRRIAERVENGDGTVGMLLTDEAMAHDIRETAANAAATTENLKNLVDQFRRSPRRFVRFSIF